MHKILLIWLVLTPFAFAQWQPSAETRSAVLSAAAFTGGDVVDCPLSAEPEVVRADVGPHDLVCVDTSITAWTAAELTQRADYGFDGWFVITDWIFADGLYLAARGNLNTNEGVSILVVEDEQPNVIYIIAPGDVE